MDQSGHLLKRAALFSSPPLRAEIDKWLEWGFRVVPDPSYCSRQLSIFRLVLKGGSLGCLCRGMESLAVRYFWFCQCALALSGVSSKTICPSHPLALNLQGNRLVGSMFADGRVTSQGRLNIKHILTRVLSTADLGQVSQGRLGEIGWHDPLVKQRALYMAMILCRGPPHTWLVVL